MTRLFALWESIRTTYWALPSTMTVGAIVLSVVMINLDQTVSTKLSWVYAGGAEGARAVLSTIAGSMIAVAGTTFSITIVALTLASQQFGPRLLRNFLRDVGNQVVLGTFVSTFVYCLLVLRTVRGQDDSAFVPHLAVTGGVVLAMLSLGVLIYFIHHISSSIQASQIIANIGADLEGTIDHLFPEPPPDQRADPTGRQAPPPAAAFFERAADAVAARANGYVQAIDVDGLLATADEHDLILRVEVRPGAFVRRDSRLLTIWPRGRLEASYAAGLRAAFVIGAERTPTQDIDFFLSQLVELAVRALSPGVNDPGTARACIDRLEQALCQLAGRPLPAPDRRADDGAVRVVTPPFTFAGVVHSAFDEIRRHSRGSVSVTTRLLDAIGDIAACARRDDDRQTLIRHVTLIDRGSRETLADAADRAVVETHRDAALAALGAAGEGGSPPPLLDAGGQD